MKELKQEIKKGDTISKKINGLIFIEGRARIQLKINKISDFLDVYIVKKQ